MSSPNPSPGGGSPIPRAAWIVMGTIGALIVILLGAVLYKLSVPGAMRAGVPATAGSTPAQPSAVARPPQSAVAVSGASPSRKPQAQFPRLSDHAPAADADGGREASTRRRTSAQFAPQQFAPQQFAPQQFAPQQVAPAPTAPACAECGVVTAVAPVREPGQANGVGAVVGGLVGGLLGNQIGAGNGRTAATVLGAVGGGLAGNEVQKRMNAKTLYRVRIRMDSGATRTLTLTNPPPLGQPVRVHPNGSLSPN